MDRVTAAPTQRRRGRPYRPPVDTTPYDDVLGGGARRIAWLLGSARLHSRGRSFANRRDFVPALNARGVVCDEPRVSRWESGTTPVPAAAIRAYESVLGLPRYALLSVASMTGQVAGDPTPGGGLAELDPLLDVAVDGTPTGADWLDLVTQLRMHPSLYMRPDNWAAVSRRLVSELCRSTGSAYTIRSLALRDLIGHPMARSHLIEAIDEYVADPCAQRSSDVIALFQHLPPRAATVRLLLLLADERPSVQRGAARAIAAMLARGTFELSSVDPLERLVRERLAADPEAVHFADVARRLPFGAAERIAASLPDHAILRLVVASSELVAGETAGLVAAGVSLAAQSRMTVDEPDRMLERLVREALFHSNGERRSQASNLLLASPYAAGLSRATAVHLDGAEVEVSGRLAQLLRYCVSPTEFPLALGAATLSGSTAVRHNALRAIGHVGMELTHAQAMLLVDGAAPWDDAMVVDATLYALGMHGQSSLAARALPGAGRVAALSAWWLRHGPRVER